MKTHRRRDLWELHIQVWLYKLSNQFNLQHMSFNQVWDISQWKWKETSQWKVNRHFRCLEWQKSEVRLGIAYMTGWGKWLWRGNTCSRLHFLKKPWDLFAVKFGVPQQSVCISFTLLLLNRTEPHLWCYLLYIWLQMSTGFSFSNVIIWTLMLVFPSVKPSNRQSKTAYMSLRVIWKSKGYVCHML